MTEINHENSICSFKKAGKINTIAATPKEHSFVNVRKAVLLPHDRLHNFPGFKQKKDKDVRINLIGGGPSIKELLPEIKQLDSLIVACGSSYDYLVCNGVIPDICVICDPDPVCVKYITKAHKDTIYFIATQCDPLVFEALKDYEVYMWHCYNEDRETFESIEADFQAVGGGCTVGLRSLSIALMLGYYNIHFYGFDSCLSKEEHHAYEFSTEDEELGHIYVIKVGTEESVEKDAKIFYCAGYQVAQVDHFKEFWAYYSELFHPVFHGDGLLPEVVNQLKQKEQSIRESLNVTKSD